MNGKICFIDADIFINAFVKLDEKKSKASRLLLDNLEQGKVRLLADYLVLIETYYVIEKYKGWQKASDVLKELLTFTCLELAAVDGVLFFEALKRKGKYKLKMNDLVHYTAALLHNAEGMYSYDRDFNGLEIKRIEP